MKKWEIFRHGYAIGVRMPSDNKTHYGGVRYVSVGGFDRDDSDQMAEVERIIKLIADAPALLEALKDIYTSIVYSSVAYEFDDAMLEEARTLIAKHGGGV